MDGGRVDALGRRVRKLVIELDAPSGRRRRWGSRGRAFQADLVAMVRADGLWEGGAGGGETLRPVYLACVTSEAEATAFVANLRCGKRVLVEGGRYNEGRLELLKSGGYEFRTQVTPEGVLITAFQRRLFAFDPGYVAGPEDTIALVLLPTREWSIAQSHALGIKPEGDGALASWFCAALDRRVRVPVIPHPDFYVQVLRAAYAERLASTPRLGHYHDTEGPTCNPSFGFRVEHEHQQGFDVHRAVAFRATVSEAEAMLARESAKFIAKR